MTVRQKHPESTPETKPKPASLRDRYPGRSPAAEAAFEARVEASRARAAAFRAEHGDPIEYAQKWALRTFGADTLRRMSEEFEDEFRDSGPAAPHSRPE